MSISELFRYRDDSFQSDIFSSDIVITDVDVKCRISPTFRSVLMPTYVNICDLLCFLLCNYLHMVLQLKVCSVVPLCLSYFPVGLLSEFDPANF
jgi:hypothetical protein